jgi:hypothetical protein
MTKVIARCVYCRARREIGAGDVTDGIPPMCTAPLCGGVMALERVVKTSTRATRPRRTKGARS